MKNYEKPAIRSLGAVRDLTGTGKLEKVGNAQDTYSQLTGLTGSVVTKTGS